MKVKIDAFAPEMNPFNASFLTTIILSLFGILLIFVLHFTP